MQYNGTAAKPRLSVFCSNRQLYAMLVDDHGKRILFYGSTLQEAICGDPRCSTVVRSKTEPAPTQHCIFASQISNRSIKPRWVIV